MIFGEKRKIIEHKMRVLILLTTLVWNITHSGKDSGMVLSEI